MSLALHIALDIALQTDAREYWPELTLDQGKCLLFISG